MPVNTAALKSFAPAMRRQLIEAVGRKLDLLLTSQTPDTLSTYASQIAELRERAAENRDQLLEQVAYSWFNRLAALRYLDAKGWHPFGCKVLMPAGEGETQPELLKLMRSGSLPLELKEHTNESRLNGLLDGQIPTAIAGADPQGEVYRELVLAVCRSYHQLLPNLFEGLDDATELLLPDDLLSEASIAGGFRREISDDDCEDVESLGWLYQFYIAEKKDEVMARKKAVPTEDIPAVTQLFTPHWIVRYLVENSLGRLWLLNRPSSGLKAHMPYYIEGETETDFLKINKPEDIKLLDPACGSGHMLTYAFDLLTLIYEEEGYAPTEIPGLILKHNLYGLEICPRAAQLAQLALVFKAREKSRRFFQPELLVRPQIIELQDVQFDADELNTYIDALELGELFDPKLFKLLHQFEEAKTFGSLIRPCLDENAIINARRAIDSRVLGDQLFLRETHLKVLQVLEQAEALTERYHVVVANPPYMGSRQLNPRAKVFGADNYPESKSDLFAMFLEKGFCLVCDKGFSAMVTMHTWMFLSSYEQLREKLLRQRAIINMCHMDNMVMGIAFGTVATIWQNRDDICRKGYYFQVKHSDLDELKTPKAFPPNNIRNIRATSDKSGKRFFRANSLDFGKLPGSPIAYWIDDCTRGLFSQTRVQNMTISDGQNITADNERFLRLLWEVDAEDIGVGSKWLPYAKGGAYRRWAGNIEMVVNWSQEARAIYRKENSSRIIPEYLWYRQGITWNRVGAGLFGFRLLPPDSTFDKVGSSIFLKDDDDLNYLLAFLNTCVTQNLLEILNPSVDLQIKDVRNLPVSHKIDRVRVESFACELRSVAQADWDNQETSLGFRDLSFLRTEVKDLTLQKSWQNWEAQCTSAIRRMQELERENNLLFIAAYGLEGELQPDVPEDQITLARADHRKDVAGFLSYSTGCMMGRYSLDSPGLILANTGDTLENYVAKVGKSSDALTFQPDGDGIIPVLDGEWFEDDIVARSREFLAVTFPGSSVADNLRFIEDSLGKDIRKYFCTDFYKDHLQTYKKRPIYWQVQSPKKGFACLIYLHRYTKDTLNLVLNNYFRPYLQKLEARLAQLGLDQLNDDLPTRERSAARKEAEKITKVLKECQAWEQDALLPLAQQRIELDLDDGVKVNYLKLQDVLTPIPGLAAKDD
jgi:hypothetical protein